MIIVIVDQLNLLALHATISPYNRSGSINGSMASIFTSDNKESAATTLDVFAPDRKPVHG